jgi:GH15 family glucan-1,4-alpha-glucosidase
MLLRVVETISRLWQEPDQGFWEVRCAPRHFVHSKVMCWAALDRAVCLAERWQLPAPLPTWRAVRDTIRATVERQGYDAERGVFVRCFGSSDLDAALLLLPSVGFVAYDDERMIRTTAAIERELGTGNGMLRRYLAPDGVAGDEGCFLACSFWLAECLARQGEIDRARRIFAVAAGAASDLGLFSEQYDAAGRIARELSAGALALLPHPRRARARGVRRRGVVAGLAGAAMRGSG